MKVTLFFTIASMFLCPVFFGVISFVLLNTERPWEIDIESNLWLLTSDNKGGGIDEFDQWLDKFDPATKASLEAFLIQKYKYGAIISLAYASFVLAVLFVGFKNIPLMLWTQITTLLTLCLVAYAMQDLYEHSRHTRLFITILVLNLLGTVSYVLFVIQYFNRKKEKAAAPVEKK